jgi:SAM-dependent methyltransferase
VIVLKGLLKKVFGEFRFSEEKNGNPPGCINKVVGVTQQIIIGELSDAAKGPAVLVEINVQDIIAELSDSWKEPTVPERQYEECVKKALRDYKNGLSVTPFDVLVDILKDNIQGLSEKTLLEIGCSSGYYSQALKIKGIYSKYYGCDFSEAFIDLAKKLSPGIDFQVQDACALGYSNNSFDIVVSGGCLLHILDYPKAIKETARTTKEYAVFHRTPVLHKKQTSYYIKNAYGIKMFEIHFNERELLRLMRENNLKVMDIITYNPSIEGSSGDFYTYKTYFCQKG